MSDDNGAVDELLEMLCAELNLDLSSADTRERVHANLRRVIGGKDAEIAALRAENEKLRAKAGSVDAMRKEVKRTRRILGGRR